MSVSLIFFSYLMNLNNRFRDRFHDFEWLCLFTIILQQELGALTRVPWRRQFFGRLCLLYKPIGHGTQTSRVVYHRKTAVQLQTVNLTVFCDFIYYVAIQLRVHIENALSCYQLIYSVWEEDSLRSPNQPWALFWDLSIIWPSLLDEVGIKKTSNP